MKEKDSKKRIILYIINKKGIENLSYKALELVTALDWKLPKACDQVAGETIGSISWFLPNYEDYGFLYFVALSELIEEKAREMLQNNKF